MSTNLTDVEATDNVRDDVVESGMGDFEPQAVELAERPVKVTPAKAVDPVTEALEGVVKDAKTRGLRTLFQGAVASVVVAAANVGGSYVHSGDLAHLDWKAAGSALAVALVAAGVAYVQRVSRPTPKK